MQTDLEQDLENAEQKLINVKSELAVSVDFHDNYRDGIDRALGQPRDLVDGSILEDHLEAIRILRHIVERKLTE